MSVMLRLAILAGLLPAAAHAAQKVSDAPPAGPPQTSTATGSYRTAWLLLEGAALGGKWQKLDVPVFLGLRDGRVVVTWFCHPQLSGQKRMWLDESTLALDGAALRGELKGRAQLGADRGGGARPATPDFVIRIDAAVADGGVSGTYKARVTGSDGKEHSACEGKLSGRLLDEKQAAGQHSLGAGAAWPAYFGVGGALRGPDCGARMVASLAQARPVWRSEEWVLTSYGNAPDMRYADRAGYTGCGGGSSSPVVWGGMVFQYYYRPSPQAPFLEKTAAGIPIDKRREDAKTLFARETEGRWYMDLFRINADDVVVAMDAATGRTLWKTVFPQRTHNIQTHKMRWLFPVPLVHDGVVYAPGSSGRLYALEAGTGRPLWEYPEADARAFIPAGADMGRAEVNAPSPVMAGGVLAFAAKNQLVGIDPRTGAALWKNPQAVGPMHRWTGDGREWLIVQALETRRNAAGKNEQFAVLHKVDPADGRSVWKTDVEFRHYSYLPLMEGDMVLGYDFGNWDANVVTGGKALAYRISGQRAEKAWEVPLPRGTDSYGLTCIGGHMYIFAEAEMLCIELASGKVAGRLDGIGGARTQVAFAADGRVFLQPEGRHGTQSFVMVNADPKDLRILGTGDTTRGPHPISGLWFPPHTHTTAYANQPIVYPVVDGRIFIRGGDGVYCYDLRARP